MLCKSLYWQKQSKETFFVKTVTFWLLMLKVLGSKLTKYSRTKCNWNNQAHSPQISINTTIHKKKNLPYEERILFQRQPKQNSNCNLDSMWFNKMITCKFPQGDHNLLKVNSPVLKAIPHKQNIHGASNNKTCEL